jgi:hypothetical protein
MSGQALIDEIERLRTEHNEFNTGARRQLYGYLQRAFGHALNLNSSPTAKDIFRVLVRKPKLKFKSESKTLADVVRYVFGDLERQRVSDYTIVLREAFQLEVDRYAVADWIEDAGGIDKIIFDKRDIRRRHDEDDNADKAETATEDAPSEQRDDIELVLPEGSKLRLGTYAAIIEVGEGRIRIGKRSSETSLLRTMRQLLTKQNGRWRREIERRSSAKKGVRIAASAKRAA